MPDANEEPKVRFPITVKRIKELQPLAEVYELHPDARYFVFLPVLKSAWEARTDRSGTVVAEMLESLGIHAVVITGTRKDAIHFYGLEESTQIAEAPAEVARIIHGAGAGQPIRATSIEGIAEAVHNANVAQTSREPQGSPADAGTTGNGPADRGTAGDVGHDAGSGAAEINEISDADAKRFPDA